ncbi:hypothetical protein [Pseudobdellovibrio exovorus]|uniref:Lipoprotein n=1 Tax=Pseudobdellovibrio exovorus JSS TaxID=1184267 RepID=M4VDS0_9BACT|nr:hypothetical protein [Pseudobdellovibrio exovorus]AGH96186.1 hypothetical protein A11Q_1970 [Pseudobdellovibrio exovorus JSS]
MLNYRLIFLICILSLTGCLKEKKTVDVTTIQVKDLAREVQIPKQVMVEIEDKLMAEVATSFSPQYILVPLQIQFTSISENVLAEPIIRYELPKGGGDIDLKNVVTGDGSFFMNFPKEQFESLPEIQHLYFISNSPLRTIDDENFGMGCGKFVDIKKSFTSLQKEDFLKLNTTDLRYLPVIAGRYLLVFRQGNQINLTQLTITDSRYTQELCVGDF